MVSRLVLGLGILLSMPAQAGITVRDLVEVTDLSGVSVSPDGKLVAFRTERASIERNSHLTRWYVAPIDGSAPPRPVGDGGSALFTDAGVLDPEMPQWTPDSRAILYRALIDGSIQVWRASADGARAEALTADPADVESFALSADGTEILYRTGESRSAIENAERAEYDAGILVDHTIDPAQPMFRGGWVNGRLASQRLAGRWFERRGLLGDRPTRERILSLADGTVRDAGPVDRMRFAAATGAGGETPAPAGAGGRALIRTAGGRQVVEVVRADGTSVRCPASLCGNARIASLAWARGRDALVVTTSDGGHAQTLWLWDLADNASRRVAESPGLLSGGRDDAEPCAMSDRFAVCVAASAGSPPLLVRIDLETGARLVVHDPNVALRAGAKVEVRRIDWHDGKGSTFVGQLFLPHEPQGRSGLPLFVTYYRCEGYVRGGMGDEWPLAVLAEHGIAALCINSAAPPGGTLDAVTKYEIALDGIAAVVKQLAGDGVIDRKRIGMGGLSFGSEVTMWAAMYSDLLSAVSIASVQMEPAYYWFNGIAGRDNHAILEKVWKLRAPDETPARWKRLSPALNTGRLAMPILMQLPEQEARWSMELHARLTHTTTPVEMIAFPDEPHIKIQPRHKLAAYERNLDWFRFWLQGAVDPAPAKRAQYQRWRSMAERWRRR